MFNKLLSIATLSKTPQIQTMHEDNHQPSIFGINTKTQALSNNSPKPSFITRHRFLSLLCLATFLLIPAIFSGFFLDDFIFIDKLRSSPLSKVIFSLYTFSPQGGADQLIFHGRLPWWSSTSLKLDFFRPLSSLLFSIDFLIFGDRPFLYHLHSLAWVLSLITIWYHLFKKFLPYNVTLLALSILICSGVFLFPVLWIANRHILVSTCLCSFSLLCYITQRENQGRYPIMLPIIGFLFAVGALFASESSLSLFFYFLFFEIFVKKEAISQRLLAIAPYIILLTTYIFSYKLFHYGADNIQYYTDPFNNPLVFIQHAFLNIPTLLNKIYLNFYWQQYPVVNFIIAISTCMVVLLYLRQEKNQTRKIYYWLMSSSIFALTPFLAVLLDPAVISRALLPSMIGASAIISFLLLKAWHERQQFLSTASPSLLLLLVFSSWLTVNYLVFSPLTMLVLPQGVSSLYGDIEKTAIDLKLPFSCEHCVVIATPYYITSIYIPSIRRYHHLFTPENWFFLSQSAGPSTLTKTGHRQFTLTTDYSSNQGDSTDKLFKNSEMKRGQIFQTTIFSATLLEQSNDLPHKTLFDFNAQDFDKICWVSLSPVNVDNDDFTSHNSTLSQTSLSIIPHD